MDTWLACGVQDPSPVWAPAPQEMGETQNHGADHHISQGRAQPRDSQPLPLWLCQRCSNSPSLPPTRKLRTRSYFMGSVPQNRSSRNTSGS